MQIPPKNRIGITKLQLDNWFQKYNNPVMAREAREVPIRRDMKTIIEYVRENKIIGTQSTGNMPLKAVQEVTSRFTNPPKLENKVGNHIYRVRSEADLWSLYFLHILADVGGLLSIAPGRRWQITGEGHEYLNSADLYQLAFLLSTWWYKTNWLVAFPYKGMGDDLPPLFHLATLNRLVNLPLESRISAEQFADGLIGETGLTWTAQDSPLAKKLLRVSIQRMVIDILADFRAIERDYRDEPLGKSTIQKLVAFEITPLGKALLEAIAILLLGLS